jgi:aldose 1-epimerase
MMTTLNEDLFELTLGKQRALIDVACGGSVHRLFLVPGDGDGTGEDILVGDNPLPGDPGRRCSYPGLFRGRLLLPFNDRIVDGVYWWRGHRYNLPLNDVPSGDAIHGFLYRQSCSVTKETTVDDAAAALFLDTTLHGVQGYPFTLDVSLAYRLERGRFSLSVGVVNNSPETAPVAAGWHPYFMLPSASGLVDDLVLSMTADHYLEVDRRLAPTGRTLTTKGGPLDFTTRRKIGNLELDHAFLGSGQEVPRMGLFTSDTPERRIILESSGIFRMFQLFIPPDRRSLAIEPVTSPANVFNRPELGLLRIAPGEALSGTIRVYYR